MSATPPLLTTPLQAAHARLGGRMVAFAGYDMPVQYTDGVLAEHRWTRTHAGLFDVSHMGPAWLSLTDHPGDTELAHQAICRLIEPLICGDIAGLAPGGLRYRTAGCWTT
jgi:aminomethyltransferase